MGAEHYPGKELEAMSSADNYRRWIGGPGRAPIGKNVLLVARRH